jgi:hypothetical protein
MWLHSRVADDRFSDFVVWGLISDHGLVGSDVSVYFCVWGLAVYRHFVAWEGPGGVRKKPNRLFIRTGYSLKDCV